MIKTPQAVLLLSMGLLVGGGYMVDTTVKTIKTDFAKKGWNEALKLSSKNESMAFFVKCQMHATCAPVMQNVLSKRHVYWYAGMAAFGLLSTLGTLRWIRKQPKIDPNYKKPGGSRWAFKEELEEYIVGKGPKDPQRGYLGILRDGTVLAAPESLRNAHNVVIGGPGAAKSTGYHKPNQILDALQGTNSVVIDLKFPDPMAGFFDMVPLFYEAGRPVQVYAPFTTSTMRLNLLQNATDIEGAYDVASMIIPTKEDEGGASFYKNIERTLLSAVLLGIANTEKPSMQRAFKICLRGAASIKEFVTTHDDMVVRDTAAGMLEIDNKTLTGIASSLANALQIFNHPAVSRATTPEEGENLDLDEFWWTPGLLYIGLEQAEVVGPRGKILIQLLKRLIDKSMLRCAKLLAHPTRGTPKLEGKMPNHVAFYLDEFPAMGVIPDISNSFAMMRSYRVSYHVTLQNLSQAEVLYTREGFRSFFNNNLQHILFFPARTKMDDAKYFSDYLGDITVTERRWSDSEQKNFFGTGGSKGESWGDAMRKMLTPGEMLSYPRNQAVLFVIGAPAVEVVMPGYYEEYYHLLDVDPKTGIGNKKGKRFLNPIHKLYKELNKHDPREFLETVLLGMDKDKISSEEQTVTEEEAFQTWAENVATHGARVTVYEDRARYVIRTDGLSSSLANPEMMEVWTQRDWASMKDGQITIRKEGLRVIGLGTQKKLKALKWRGPVMLWLNHHAAMLENHPIREYSSGDLPPPEGRYEQETIIIPVEAVKQIWEGVLPPDKFIQRVGSVNMYRIPINDDEFLIIMQSRMEAQRLQGKEAQGSQQKGSGNAAKNDTKTNTNTPKTNREDSKPQDTNSTPPPTANPNNDGKKKMKSWLNNKS